MLEPADNLIADTAKKLGINELGVFRVMYANTPIPYPNMAAIGAYETYVKKKQIDTGVELFCLRILTGRIHNLKLQEQNVVQKG